MTVAADLADRRALFDAVRALRRPTATCRGTSSTSSSRCSPGATPPPAAQPAARWSASTASTARCARRPGAERLIYLSGGTIPDRGYFHLRVDGSGAPLGRARRGVRLGAIGRRHLHPRRADLARSSASPTTTSSSRHADARSAMAPFWRAEERDRSPFLSERIGRFPRARRPRLRARRLRRRARATDFHLEPAAAAELRPHCSPSRWPPPARCPTATRWWSSTPWAPAAAPAHRQMVLHTVWGGRVNRPFALRPRRRLEAPRTAPAPRSSTTTTAS